MPDSGLLPEDILKARRDRKALRRFAKKIKGFPETVRRYT